jgi:predicted nucleic acid-binding protein
MYLVDTNVVSELRKKNYGKAEPAVVAWGNTAVPETLFLSVISILELEHGMLLMTRRDPRQGRALQTWLTNDVMPSFSGRILNIDTAVARRCAALHVQDPRPERDAMIAATALVHGMTIVTRNEKGFALPGVKVFNPWGFVL